MKFCRSKREEERIIAWENLKKAKAEAAIRNLEVSAKPETVIVYEGSDFTEKVRSMTGEAGEGEIVVHGEDLEEIKVCSKEGSGYEGCPGFPTGTSSCRNSENWPHERFLELLHLPSLLT